MEAENPRAVVGNNAPPDPLLVEASERIDAYNRLIKDNGEWEKWDKDTADKVAFFISQIAATFKALDDRRLDEGRAFKLEQDKVYKDPLALLTMARNRLNPLKTAWLRREEDRLEAQRREAEERAAAAKKAAEDAERKAKEAEAKGADPLRAELAADQAWDNADAAADTLAALPEKATIKGSYTTLANTLRDYWSGEITDLSAAFKALNKRNSPHKATLEAAIRECIQGIANREAKRIKDENSDAIPGVKFKKDRR